MALVYDRNKDFLVDQRLDEVRFTRKRKVGRPKKLGLALAKEPLLVVVNGQLQEPGRPGDRGEAVAGARGPEEGGGQVEPTQAAVPANISNNWSSLPIFLGNIQVTDRGLQPQPAELGTSSAEDDVEELNWNL